MPKFALVGNGPLSNRGCEAIVKGTINILDSEFQNVDYLLASFSEDPVSDFKKNIKQINLPFRINRWSGYWWQYRFNRLLGKPEDKSRFLKILDRNLEGVDVAFSIGGDGYAIDYGHQIVDRLLIMDDYIKNRGIPMVIWGASIGPFDKEPDFERKIINHLKRIDLIVVREPISFNYLVNLGIRDNVILAPDPAFALTPLPCVLHPRIKKILKNNCIGLNLSPLIARYATENNLEKWALISISIIERLITDYDLPIILIPHVTFEKNRPKMDDELFLREVYNKIKPKFRKKVVILPRNLSSQNLKWVISQTKLFVGSRTHSTIAALSSCIPSISIAYSRKAWGINELVFGHTDWVYSSQGIDPGELSTLVGTLLQSSENVQNFLKEVIPKKMNDAFAPAKKIKEMIS